jgi:hypothetical protein
MHDLPRALRPLTRFPNWGIWRRQNGKKVPYQALHPKRFAKSNDAATWSSYQDARASLKHGNGLAFLLTDTEIGAIDLDDCRNSRTGAVDDWAARIIDRADSYTEVTPSQRGLRVIGFAHGAPVHTSCDKGRGHYELYRRATRYVTISGDEVGRCDTLRNIDALIDRLTPPKRPVVRRNGALDIDVALALDWRPIAKRIGKGLRAKILSRNAPRRHRLVWLIATEARDAGATPNEIAAVAYASRAFQQKWPNNDSELRRLVEKVIGE